MLAAGKCRWLLSGPDGPMGPLAVCPQSGAWGFILSLLLGCSGPCAHSGSLPCLNIPGFPGSHRGGFATLLLTVPSVGPAVPPSALLAWAGLCPEDEGPAQLRALGSCSAELRPGAGADVEPQVPWGARMEALGRLGGCPRAYPCLSVLTCLRGAVRRWGCEDWVYWGSSHWTAWPQEPAAPREGGSVCLDCSRCSFLLYTSQSLLYVWKYGTWWYLWLIRAMSAQLLGRSLLRPSR